MHCHPLHADALIVVAGMMRLGLRDLRPGSPTEGAACTLDLDGDAMQLVTIPPGVAHGFYFPVPSMHVYAVDRSGTRRTRWAAAGTTRRSELDWGIERPVRVSERDARLGALRPTTCSAALAER